MTGSSWKTAAAAAGMVLLGATGAAGFTTLGGSHAKMVRQNTVAHEDHYEFAQTPADIARLVIEHQLVALPGSADYTTKGVSFAFARPQVLYFVERLAYEYHQACGQPLVITSLVRPISLRLRGSSPLSVHPAGIAADLHIPDAPACRTWLVNRLLALAANNVLDVTEEHHPPHLHVAVFPNAYMAWAAKQPAVPVALPGRQPAVGRLATRPASAAVPELGGLDVGKTAAAVATTLALVAVVGAVVVRPLRLRSRRGHDQDTPPVA